MLVPNTDGTGGTTKYARDIDAANGGYILRQTKTDGTGNIVNATSDRQAADGASLQPLTSTENGTDAFGNKISASNDYRPDGSIARTVLTVNGNISRQLNIQYTPNGGTTVTSLTDNIVITIGHGLIKYAGFDERGNMLLSPSFGATPTASDPTVMFGSDGKATVGINGMPLFIVPAGTAIAIGDGVLSMATKHGELSGNITLSHNNLAVRWTSADGKLSVNYAVDLGAGGDAIQWQQNGSNYQGGDLGSFIANTVTHATQALSASATQSSGAALSGAMAAPAEGVAAALGNAASERYLAARLALGAVSDRWAPVMLSGTIPAGMSLAGSQTAAIQQALANLAQQQWQLRQTQPSIFTVRVLEPHHPLVLDLSGAGVKLLAPWQSNATFDLDADGRREQVGWVGADNGILVFDKNGNGKIDSAAEWFGESFSVNGAPPPRQNGFAALATLAASGATSFSRQTAGSDPASGASYFDLVRIWVDANQDGNSDAGEFFTLAELGITSIDLQSRVDGRQLGGGEIALTAAYTRSNGTRGDVADVGLVAQGNTAPAQWMPGAAALQFANYASRGYAAQSRGQGQGILAALAANQVDVSGAIAALQTRMAKTRVLVTQGSPTPLIKVRDQTLITTYLGENHTRYTERGSTAGLTTLALLQESTAFAATTGAAATALVAGADAIVQAQTAAQVANASGTAGARSQADSSAASAAAAWGNVASAYLNAGATSAQLNARMESLRLELNTLVPLNNSYFSQLSGGYTYFSPGDASFAGEAFEGYAGAVQRLSNMKIALDNILGAMAQSAGYTQAYVGQANTTVTAGNGFNLLLAGAGAQSFALGNSVDHVLLNPATGSVTLQGFQTGTGGDQLQFLGLGNSVSVRNIAGGVQLLAADGQRAVNLMGVNADNFNLYANVTGVAAISFADFTQAGTRSIEGERLYDGQVHITHITASHYGDTLIGDTLASTLIGGAGNDTFVVAGKGYRIDGGGGEDGVSYSKSEGGVTADLRSGTDSLGSTLLQVEHLLGSAYRDRLVGDGRNNVLEGGRGYDALEGSAGNDTYVWRKGDGNDLVWDQDATANNLDVLRLANVGAQDVRYARSGNDLLVTVISTNETITVHNQYAGVGERIEQVEFADGSRKVMPVLNSAPTGAVSLLLDGSVLSASSALMQGNVLTAAHSLADADGLGAMQYQWYADDVAIAGATAGSYAPTKEHVGKHISVVLRYTDGFGTPESVRSISTAAVSKINNSPAGSVTIAGLAVEGQTLTASHNLSDADGLGAVAYQWYADGVAIAGAASASLTLAAAQANKRVTVRASYTDGLGILESRQSSPTAAVLHPNKPVSGTLSLLLGDAEVAAGSPLKQGDVLRVRSSLADADGMGTLTYQWYANEVAIAGANGDSLALTQALVGKNIRVKAAYTDGFGAAESAGSVLSAGVANVNDAPTGAVSIDGTPRYGQTLSAVHSLADADGLGAIRYQWYADGAAIAGAVNASLSLGQDQVDKAIHVTASYVDNFGAAESVSSRPTTAVTDPDRFVGTANADLITGSAGADRMEGLAGDDVYHVNHAGDVVTELADGGRDTVYTLVNYALGDNIEEVRIGAAGLTVTGNAVHNIFYVNASGNNVLDGGGGGNVVNYMNAKTGVTATLVSANQPRPPQPGGDLLSNFLTIIGSKFADVLTGNEAKNSIIGGAGNDVLQGGKGNDVLVGGPGDDTYIFARGDGADMLNENGKDDSHDIISFMAGVQRHQLWFRQVGMALEVSIIGTDDKIMVNGWYSEKWPIVEEFRTADGYTLPGYYVQSLVQAMANLAPPPSGQQHLPVDYHTALDPTITMLWQLNNQPTGSVQLLRTSQQTLTAVHTLNDQDGMGAVRYQWYADNLALDWPSTANYTLTPNQLTQKFSVKVSYLDSKGTTEAVSSIPTLPNDLRANYAFGPQSLQAAHWYADGDAPSGPAGLAGGGARAHVEQLVQAMAGFAPPSAAPAGWSGHPRAAEQILLAAAC
ncbi:calcium-binding protein [Janthinobacterium fluminis]|uniref:Calcium-binding protein n=1 Tax=Janthinobacterium fluminis TaxID=2987524 RepID=A0ABT5JZG0_9BURK|nr:calcium-binding protein [Janthinobacterium fluminis]MDC8757866.1 calcium-binding protein [Janthinobacterium fluminis]